MKQLAAVNIGTAIHYPVPLHLQKAYAALGYQAGDFPVAETVAPEIMSLPMFPQLTVEQQERTISALVELQAAPAAPLAQYAASSL